MNYGIYDVMGELLMDGFEDEKEANAYADRWMEGESVMVGPVEEVEAAKAEEAE